MLQGAEDFFSLGVVLSSLALYVLTFSYGPSSDDDDQTGKSVNSVNTYTRHRRGCVPYVSDLCGVLLVVVIEHSKKISVCLRVCE